jgi:hypothetical protein
MNKKWLILIVFIVSALALSSCSTIQAFASTGSQNGTQQGGTAQAGQQRQFTASPEMRLAIGIMKLEGTPNAVTADQAKTLLPLWKGMKALGAAGSNSTQEEVTGLDDQIKAALTPEQVKAIDAVDLSPQNMRTIFSSLGIQFGNGNFNRQGGTGQNGTGQTGQGGNNTNRQNGGQNFGGGNFQGGGQNFGGGNFQGGGQNFGNGQNGGTRSSTPGAPRNINGARRLPQPLITAVIDLLTKKAGA